MVYQNLTALQTARLRTVAAAAASALGGWLAFNSHVLDGYGVERLIAAGLVFLVLAWRLATPGRLGAFLVLFAWYCGAGSAIPAGWRAFFGNGSGGVALALWSACCALPALALPKRFYGAALCVATLVAAATPIGMMSPLLATMSLFPALGWWGLAAAALTLLVVAIRPARPFVAVATLLLFGSLILNVRYSARAPSAEDALPTAWAMQSANGGAPVTANDWLMRQARDSNTVADTLKEGARLVVTPEGTTDMWLPISQAFWREPTALARQEKSTVLLGLYRANPHGSGWQDGLLDLATSRFYPAAVPMPVSMWHPWRLAQHMPFNWKALTMQIPTVLGRAAYTVCYEEMLVWPLAARMLPGRPAFIISAANQWFATAFTAESQKRSIDIQARLWGLPLLRAVNRAAPQ